MLGYLTTSKEAASAGTLDGFANARSVLWAPCSLQSAHWKLEVKVCSLHCSQLGFWRRRADKYGGTAGHLGWWLSYVAKSKSFVLPRAGAPWDCSFAQGGGRSDRVPALKNGNVFINPMSCVDPSCHPWIISLNSLPLYHPQMCLKSVLSKEQFEKGKCTRRLLSRLFGLYAWRLVLTAPKCITAFSILPVGFLPFNLGEGVGQTSQPTNLIYLKRHNSGYLTWFEHNITKEEEYASAR